MFRQLHSRRPLVLALTLVAVLGLGACRSAVDAQQNPVTPIGPVVPGGDLRVGVLGDLSPKTFIQIGNHGLNGHVLANVFDTLISVDPETPGPRPSLATSWAVSPDGKTVDLTLRDDVTFHSGRPFTSADVQTSLRAYLDGPWTPQFKRTAAAITDYDTSDPHRVVLSLKHPLGNIFDLLDSAPMLDSETLDELKAGKKFVGTGPFRFESWTPNASVQIVRNDEYWGGPPPLDSVTFVIANDPKSLYTRLRTGQLDVVDGLSNSDQQIATRRYGFIDVALNGAEAQQYVGVNVANPVLADVRIRRAIALAIDRERIIQDVFRGSGYPINVPWPKTSAAYDPKANTTYTRDVERAKQILADVGPLPPIELDYMTVGDTSRIVAEIVQSDLEDIGLHVDLVPNDKTIHSSKLIGGNFDGLWILEHAFAQYTPSTLAVSAYPFNADKNASNFVSAEYAAAAEAAWKTPDPASAEAEAAYRRLDDVWLEDLFLVEIGVVIPRVTTAPGVRDVGWDRRVQLHFGKTSLADPDGRS